MCHQMRNRLRFAMHEKGKRRRARASKSKKEREREHNENGLVPHTKSEKKSRGK